MFIYLIFLGQNYEPLSPKTESNIYPKDLIISKNVRSLLTICFLEAKWCMAGSWKFDTPQYCFTMVERNDFSSCFGKDTLCNNKTDLTSFGKYEPFPTIFLRIIIRLLMVGWTHWFIFLFICVFFPCNICVSVLYFVFLYTYILSMCLVCNLFSWLIEKI